MCLLFLTAPHTFAEDYNTVLDRLGRLQALANSYVETEDSSADPIVLTLSYTRTGDYTTKMWQLTAGVPDAAFENYVNTNDSDLQSLQGMSTVTLPGGQTASPSRAAGAATACSWPRLITTRPAMRPATLM